MELKGIIFEDFVNYKKPCMTLEFPKCSFKCDKECGSQVCQNSTLAAAPSSEYSSDLIITKYLENPITEAIVCQGLEPLDSFNELFYFIFLLRKEYHCNDTVVIYTGYKKEEIQKQLKDIKRYNNIIIKYGRFLPNQTPHYDEVLGVNLASDNQYAEVL